MQRSIAMMTFDEILTARRSVRAFDPERPVPPEHVLAMCEAAQLAPSACDTQIARFIAVTDPELRRQVCGQGMGSVVRNKFSAKAPLILVGCADIDVAANRVAGKIIGLEYYQLDMGIAMEHIVLKATELGLGTCWLGWNNEETLRTILGIPSRARVMALIAVGYSTRTTAPKRRRTPLSRVLFGDQWGGTFP
jgi:nitroreductase